MKRILLGIFVLFTFIGKAQNVNYFFSDYKNSTVLVVGENQSANAFYNSYGIVMNTTNSLSLFQNRYQSQEYDENLNIYFFPQRIYSAKTMRFNQPDPMSQYYSPYLFVGADPVNIIDRNGLIGKPLVLYQENYNYPSRLDRGLSALRERVPNAHFHPMSRFLNEEIGQLPEWNGNVFLMGHMGIDEEENIVVESSHRPFREVNPKIGTVTHDIPSRETLWTCDGKEMGALLRKFSEERGVPVKNVIAGGCKGSYAAKRLSMGFSEASGAIGSKGKTANFAGIKGGKRVSITGYKKSFWLSSASVAESLEYHICPEGDKLIERHMESGDANTSSKWKVRNEYGQINIKDVPSVNEMEIPSFVDGDIPSRVTSEFEFFPVKY